MRMRTMLSAAVLSAATITPAVAIASPSHAVRTHTWERLAQCESSGRWHINTGNGYYGGLQISRSTWHAHGGGRFAARPDRATKRQQIRVATRIKHNQGWGAWPACSARIGVR